MFPLETSGVNLTTKMLCGFNTRDGIIIIRNQVSAKVELIVLLLQQAMTTVME